MAMPQSLIRTSILSLALTSALGAWVYAAQGTQTQGQGRAGGAATTTQTPTRDTQTQQQQQVPATGVISGVVTSEGSGSPIRRARVTLSAPEVRGGRTTITNDQGQFSFTALPAGRFTMIASKPGYVDIPYGAKRAGRPGTAIQLAAGGKMERANISLPKGAVITGIVVDDTGEPAPGTQVRVMRYVMRTGERTLEQAGQAQTDDRGLYRVYGLQPGNYLVSAVPRNLNAGNIRQTIEAEIEALMQQIQSGALGAGLGGRGGGAAGGGGRGGGRAGAGGIDIQSMMGGRGGGNPDLVGRAQQLMQQLAQQDEAAQTAYAPVYFPGTATPSTAAPVTLGVSEERAGVDFRLLLVPTATIEGTVTSQGAALPTQGTQVSLTPLDQVGSPSVPGMNNNTTRTTQDGKFTFQNIPPGQYRLMARGAIRLANPQQEAAAAGRAGAAGGRGQGPGGGRGGPGQIQQVLWGHADVAINGENVGNVSITMQEGMTLTGRIAFDGATNAPPTDLSTVRVNLTPRGQNQGFDMGGVPPAEVDASGRFTIKGVLPGRYSLNANIPGAGRAGGGGGGGRGGAAGATTPGAPSVQWVMKSVMVGGRDALDFGVTIEPNQNVAGATILFTDRTQELTGTIQDVAGNPTADYTIIVFSADKNFWTPQARRIAMARPDTAGKFTFRQLPAGDYRLTAVTDVEQGEWFDPAFLEQLLNASIPVSLRDGEKKTQDIKVAGGG